MFPDALEATKRPIYDREITMFSKRKSGKRASKKSGIRRQCEIQTQESAGLFLEELISSYSSSGIPKFRMIPIG
jgi:hypothetical protein